MPTVYVINRSSHDFSDAERYGRLEFLTEGSVNRFATANMVRIFADSLKNSQAEDYILPTGLNIMTVIACVVFALKHKALNLLLFKRVGPKGSYVARNMDFRFLDE